MVEWTIDALVKLSMTGNRIDRVNPRRQLACRSGADDVTAGSLILNRNYSRGTSLEETTT